MLPFNLGWFNDGIEIDLETISTFDRVTEWKKDAWTSTRGFPSNLADYLECSKILNAE